MPFKDLGQEVETGVCGQSVLQFFIFYYALE